MREAVQQPAQVAGVPVGELADGVEAGDLHLVVERGVEDVGRRPPQVEGPDGSEDGPDLARGGRVDGVALAGGRPAGDALDHQYAAVGVGRHQARQPDGRAVPDERPVDRDLVVEVRHQLVEHLTPDALRRKALGDHRGAPDGAGHQDVAAAVTQDLARGERGTYPRDVGQRRPHRRRLQGRRVDPLDRYGLGRPPPQQPVGTGAAGGEARGAAVQGGVRGAQPERRAAGQATRVGAAAVGAARRRPALRYGLGAGPGAGRAGGTLCGTGGGRGG